MNAHEATMNGSAEKADPPGIPVGSAKQRTRIDCQEIKSLEKMRTEGPTKSSTMSPFLKYRQATVPGLSAVDQDFADISPRTSASEHEADETKGTAKSSQGGMLPVVSTLGEEEFANISPQTSASDDESDENCDSMRELFKKSYEYIKPGPFFRFVVNFYAERKLFVFFWIHFVTTMIIWGKYSRERNDTAMDADVRE
jgi:hypothetical protein